MAIGKIKEILLLLPLRAITVEGAMKRRIKELIPKIKIIMIPLHEAIVKI